MNLSRTFICIAAVAAMAGPAAAAKQRHVHRAQSGGQIACTVAGCHRIPAQCHPEMGYTPWGNPSGFDIVVCPR